MPSDPLSRPVIEIERDLRERRASAQELVEAAIARHERFGERLHAYSLWAPDQARAVGHLVRGQIGVGAGVAEARPLAGAAAFDRAGVVLHKDRVVVEPSEAILPQEMRKPVAAPLELGLAACRHHESRLPRPDLGLQTRIYRCSR